MRIHYYTARGDDLMYFDTITILTYVLGLFILLLLCRLFIRPLRWVLGLACNAVLGGAAMFILNYLGTFLHFHFAINPFTALITGILGIPGLIMQYILQLIL